MQVPDHVATALEFLEAADRELADGDYLQGSEKLWGAASHAVIAVAKQRGWRCHSHKLQKRAVQRLVRESRDASIDAGYKSAETLHASFYAGFIGPDKFGEFLTAIRNFVNRVLNLVGSNP